MGLFRNSCLVLAAAALVLISGLSFGQALQDCADQFIDGNVSNAPTIGNTPPHQPAPGNVHLCYRDDGISFYALEYQREEFAPIWVAYKLSPENYGKNGCATFTRDVGRCYAKKGSWKDFLSCKGGNDPFHADYMLDGAKLEFNDFANTGHDRGHLAPRQAFSWHVCAAYQTFTMANMSPQNANFNQRIWADLEKQELTWAFDEGPLYVVTGVTFSSFPYSNFDVYTHGVLDPDHIYPRDSRMWKIVQQLQENYNTTKSNDILRPARDGKHDKLHDHVRNMLMPTGYFKVIYRPEMNGESEHAIGFLLPHSFENLHMLPANKAFWSFVARIDLIETASGIIFPGIPDKLKSEKGDQWFMQRQKARDIRLSSCGRGTPQGILKNSTGDQRIAACTDSLKSNLSDKTKNRRMRGPSRN